MPLLNAPNVSQLYEYWFAKIDSSPVYFEGRMEIWFRKRDAHDAFIRETFSPWLERMSPEQVSSWRATPRGAVSLLVLWDQVPRNSFRDSARAFQWDAKALKLAKELITNGTIEKRLQVPEAVFLYMPLEHSESLDDQKLCVARFENLHQAAEKIWNAYTEQSLDYAVRHLKIIERFGRFPHRNAALARESTPEEVEFLKEAGSSF